MLHCASHVYPVDMWINSSHSDIFLVNQTQMLLGSGPRENNVKWGWVEVPSPRRNRKKYHSFGSGGWMSCGMLMFIVGLGGSIVEQKAQMNLFLV